MSSIGALRLRRILQLMFSDLLLFALDSQLLHKQTPRTAGALATLEPMDASTMKDFIHDPLDSQRKEVRLIRLRLDQDNTISCDLHRFELDNDYIPDCRALSYTWGPPHPTRKILVNGDTYSIRRNLHDFFVVALQRKFDRWLWIDQVCIAQDDIVERNHQVSLMAAIYTHASMGIVWLGKDTSGSPALVSDYLMRCRAQTVDKLNVYMQLTNEEKADASLLKQHDDARDAFCGNPYWRRVWIIQELKLLRYYEFWWDDYILPHKGFSNLWHTMWFRERSHTHQNKERIVRLLGQTCHPEANQAKNPTLSTKHPRYTSSGRHRRRAEYKLREVVQQVCDADCADLRDKVFGVQSILCADSRTAADYRISINDVLHGAVKVLLQEWRSHESGAGHLLGFLKLCRRLAASMLQGEGVMDFLVDCPCNSLLREGFAALLRAPPRPKNIIWCNPEAPEVLEKVVPSRRGINRENSLDYDTLSIPDKASLCTRIVIEEIMEYDFVRTDVDQALQTLDRRNAQHAAQRRGRPWSSPEFPPYEE